MYRTTLYQPDGTPAIIDDGQSDLALAVWRAQEVLAGTPAGTRATIAHTSNGAVVFEAERPQAVGFNVTRGRRLLDEVVRRHDAGDFV